MTAARRARIRGISTAEVLVGGALTLVIMAISASFFQAQQKALNTENTYTESQAVTRTVIDLFSRELRMASYDPTLAALPPAPGPNCPTVPQGIVEATTTSIRFKQDLDGNGVIDGANEDVRYALAEGQITRTDGLAVTTALVTGVPANGLAFRYFNGSNPPIELVPVGVPPATPALTPGQRDCVAKVQITVSANIANPNPSIQTPITSTAESRIAIRNRSLSSF